MIWSGIAKLWNMYSLRIAVRRRTEGICRAAVDWPNQPRWQTARRSASSAMYGFGEAIIDPDPSDGEQITADAGTEGSNPASSSGRSGTNCSAKHGVPGCAPKIAGFRAAVLMVRIHLPPAASLQTISSAQPATAMG